MSTALEGVVAIEIPPQLEYVALVRRLVAVAAEQSALARERLEDVELATSEAVANAVHAQRRERRPEPIRVRCGVDTSAFVVEVLDVGGGFLPPDPDAFDRREWPSKDTGLGLAIVRSVTDDVIFEDTDEGTCAQLRFALDGASRPAEVART